MSIDLDKEEINNSTKLIIKLLKYELTDKYNLTENHVIKVFIYEKNQSYPKKKLKHEEWKVTGNPTKDEKKTIKLYARS